MPRFIGMHYNQGATRALRHTRCKGTICCVLDGLPAVDRGKDGRYYCAYHLRKMYGYLPVR